MLYNISISDNVGGNTIRELNISQVAEIQTTLIRHGINHNITEIKEDTQEDNGTCFIGDEPFVEYPILDEESEWESEWEDGLCCEHGDDPDKCPTCKPQNL